MYMYQRKINKLCNLDTCMSTDLPTQQYHTLSSLPLLPSVPSPITLHIHLYHSTVCTGNISGHTGEVTLVTLGHTSHNQTQSITDILES